MGSGRWILAGGQGGVAASLLPEVVSRICIGRKWFPRVCFGRRLEAASAAMRLTRSGRIRPDPALSRRLGAPVVDLLMRERWATFGGFGTGWQPSLPALVVLVGCSVVVQWWWVPDDGLAWLPARFVVAPVRRQRGCCAGGERVSGLRRVGAMSKMLRVKACPVVAGRWRRRPRASFPSLEALPWRSPTSYPRFKIFGRKPKARCRVGRRRRPRRFPPLGRRLEAL